MCKNKLNPLNLRQYLSMLDFPLFGRDSYFSVDSTVSPITLPEITSPISIPGITQIGTIKRFELDASTNSIKNISGRSLNMVGDMAVQFEQTGAQPSTLYIASESSIDGINWTYNPKSLRAISVEKTGIDYVSIPSLSIDLWPNNTYIRFVFAKSGIGGINIVTPTETLGSETIQGHSFVWTMRERQ